MKKQKMQSIKEVSIIYGVLFFLGIIICGSVYILIGSVSEPKFTIYEEECRNETIYVQEYCYYDNETLYVDILECENKWIPIKKEVCEDIEVDEIEMRGLNLEKARECSRPFGDTNLTIVFSITIFMMFYISSFKIWINIIFNYKFF